MSKQMREKPRVVIVMILCTIAFLILQGFVTMSGRFGLATFNGAAMAIQFGMSLIILRQDYKKGFILAMVLTGTATLALVFTMVSRRDISPIPGFFNSMIYIVVLILLALQFQKREQEALSDMLTGLYNRRALQREMRRHAEEHKKFHVIYVDLSNFKMINDNYGHRFGDMILVTMAERMRSVVGRNGIIARSGGGDFVIMVEKKVEPVELANRVLNKMREKVILRGEEGRTECYVSVYAGIASYPNQSDQVEDVLKYADIAMYEAMRLEMSEPCVFDKSMEDAVKHHLEVKEWIIKALAEDYFYLVYQPQYRTTDKRLHGFETLIRMKLPDGRIVSPGEFIPVAEKSDLIIQIDDYVLRRSMMEFRDVVHASGDQLILSINVSARNFSSEDFERRLLAILAETGFPAHCLEIEITEYCLVNSMDQTIENIHKLRDFDIRVALDDFGTGYTALSYLAKMPINVLKIDKALVDDICIDAKSRSFVSAIISMGHLMDCEVLVEGVEEDTQLQILRERGSDYIQGFVWGRPLPYEEALTLSAQCQ